MNSTLKIQEKSTKQSTIASNKGKWKPVTPGNNPPISDPYLTPEDAIWKNVIIHEKLLDSCWNQTWASYYASPNVHDSENTKQNAEKCANTLYFKSSSVIGTFHPQVLEKQKTFVTRPVVSKVRFVSEQYGHYRQLKHSKTKAVENDKSKVQDYLPSYKNRHTVNPLLC